MNGAAARCVQVGDKVIIMCYCSMDEKEAKDYKPIVVFANEDNTINKISNYERN